MMGDGSNLFIVRYIEARGILSTYIESKDKHPVHLWFGYIKSFIGGKDRKWTKDNGMRTIQFETPLDKLIHIKITLLHKGFKEMSVSIKETPFIYKLPLHTRIMMKEYLNRILQNEKIQKSLTGISTNKENMNYFDKFKSIMNVIETKNESIKCQCTIL